MELLLLVLLAFISLIEGGKNAFLPTLPLKAAARALQALNGTCFDTSYRPEWWSYQWCYLRHARQFHFSQETKTVESKSNLGKYRKENSRDVFHQYFAETKKDCDPDIDVHGKGSQQRSIARTADVDIHCCPTQHMLQHAKLKTTGPSIEHTTFIDQVIENRKCHYEILVCSSLVCRDQPYQPVNQKDVGVNERSRIETSTTPRAEENSNSNPKQENVEQEALNEETPEQSIKREKQLPTSERLRKLDRAKQLNRVRELFTHGYDNYMAHAFPLAELKPLTCKGGKFSLIDLPLVTLIDTLDTFVIMGNYSEFKKATNATCSYLPIVTEATGFASSHKDAQQSRTIRGGFGIDMNVSVFETTIRLVGGLLSAHLMAVDPRLGIYELPTRPFSRTGYGGAVFPDGIFTWDYLTQLSDPPKSSAAEGQGREDSSDRAHDKAPSLEQYDHCLLRLAIDLADRILPAFDTDTGIPYGTINLAHGVPKGETVVASTAGAGSLLLELEVLSRITGDTRYGDAAFKAMVGLFDRRSSIGLLGKHINIQTGKWYESTSGVGSNSDSYYEYLIKAYLLFHDSIFLHMFSEAYWAIKEFVQDGDWFSDVDMYSGKSRRPRSENLQAFWAGMEAQLGYLSSSSQLLNAFYAVWNDMGLFPEEFDYSNWMKGSPIPPKSNFFYPLRPEIIESTYHHYRSSGDQSWLLAGVDFMDAIESKTRVECGFAGVSNLASGALDDSMPSFFLSETAKYLYLLFDESNFVHKHGYVFSTEAHPFDQMQLRPAWLQDNDMGEDAGSVVKKNGSVNFLHGGNSIVFEGGSWDQSGVYKSYTHAKPQSDDAATKPPSAGSTAAPFGTNSGSVSARAAGEGGNVSFSLFRRLISTLNPVGQDDDPYEDYFEGSRSELYMSSGAPRNGHGSATGATGALSASTGPTMTSPPAIDFNDVLPKKCPRQKKWWMASVYSYDGSFAPLKMDAKKKRTSAVANPIAIEDEDGATTPQSDNNKLLASLGIPGWVFSLSHGRDRAIELLEQRRTGKTPAVAEICYPTRPMALSVASWSLGEDLSDHPQVSGIRPRPLPAQILFPVPENKEKAGATTTGPLHPPRKVKKTTTSTASSSGSSAATAKNEVVVPSLGRFTVELFNDGFKVYYLTITYKFLSPRSIFPSFAPSTLCLFYWYLTTYAYVLASVSPL
jgi:mannosidase alpha-like ER degradation enhancer 2